MRKKNFAITQRFQCHAADLSQHSLTQFPWELNGFFQSAFRLTALQQGSIRVPGEKCGSADFQCQLVASVGELASIARARLCYVPRRNRECWSPTAESVR
jgi:hypothetical protein